MSLPPPPPQGLTAVWTAARDGWREQPASLRVLRVFLGATFVYAGAQKLFDPDFLHAGSPEFIGSQLQAFAQGSPIGWFMRALDAAPVLTGIGIAVAEIAIGLGTLAGVAPVLLAFGGFLVNLTLTLSATWHVHPYFLGSDSIYAVAWLAYGLGVLEIRRRSERASARETEPRPSLRGVSRREFLRGAGLALASVATAGAAASVAASPVAARADARGTTASPPAGAGPSSHADGSGPSTAPPVQGPPSVKAPFVAEGPPSGMQGTPIADLSQIPVGSAIPFEDPGVGSAALVRIGESEVVAYSRVCTHGGCLVGYDSEARLLVCPCHGAQFDPARGAEVVAGPAPSPLAPVDVAVDP